MEKERIFQRNAGSLALLLSGICVISSGIVVNMLREVYGFVYDVAGILLSLMSIGSLLAGFTSSMLPVKIGTKETMVLLTADHGAGYLIMGLSRWMPVLVLGFFLVSVAKGSTVNICTILVTDNSGDRTKDMSIMYSCCTLGALLCPFFIGAAMKAGNAIPMLMLASCGFLLQLTFCVTPAETKAMRKDGSVDKSSLKGKKSQLPAGLLFCRNAMKTGVTGWTVTYFKGNGIISGSLSPCTVAVMWGVTLIAHLLIAFIIPIRNSYSAMTKMGIGYIIFYLGPMIAGIQTTAILLLFTFAFVTAGMGPTTVASAGRVISATNMGVMLPAAGSGAIIMPWIVGMVVEHVGIETGMASNIIPCVGILLFSVAVKRLKEQELWNHVLR